MASYILNPQEWKNHKAILPSEKDFDPYGGDLDAQSAWEDFGNLTLSQAYDKFLDNPEHYQEDFMWMGGKAFAYYYPVIERYLHETEATDETTAYYDCQAWILSFCIKMQIESKTANEIEFLKERLGRLIQFVIENAGKFTKDEERRKEIQSAWEELKVIINNNPKG